MPFIALLVFATCAFSQQAQQPINNPAVADHKQQAKGPEQERQNIKPYSPNQMPVLPVDGGQASVAIKNQGQYSKQNESDNLRSWANVLKDPPSMFTGVLAFLTFLLVCSGLWQLWIVRDTEKRQLRAYVFPEKFTLVNAIGPGLPKLRGEFKNSGQTPAFGVTGCSDFIWGPYPPTRDFTLIDNPQTESEGSVGPGIAITVDLPLDSPIAKEDREALRLGKLAIYFYGWISYRDIFGNQHKTNFRVCYRDSLTSNRVKMLFTCKEGNEAD